MLTFIDWFAGIGGIRLGLEQAGMKCVGFCEFDKYAVKSYRAMHDTTNEWLANDVTKVEPKDIPKADLWSFGFPCQDISIAGKQRGLENGKRSGLFFEIIRLLQAQDGEHKPKWLLIENVRNLLSIDKGWGFARVLCELGNAGYDCQWSVLNSKDFGVPQNRERVFIVGYFRGRSCGKIFSFAGANTKTVEQIGNIIETTSFGGNPQTGRVYSANGLAPTLNTCQGGGREPKVMYNAIPIKNATKEGYCLAQEGDGINLAYPDSNTRRGRVQPGLSNTLQTGSSQGVLIDAKNIRIRKLTPKECFRLQGYSDEYFERAQAVNSNCQLYKQAGNGVTVNVAKAIGERIMEIERVSR